MIKADAVYGPLATPGGPMRDWTEITIRPVLEVRCPVHGLLGHTVRADEARTLRRAHWDAAHTQAGW